MLIVVFGYAISTFAANLLTHQKISAKLNKILEEYKEKKYKCIQDGRYNEIVFFKHDKNTNIQKLIEESLNVYRSTLKEVVLYLVSATILEKNRKDIKRDVLLSYAAEIITKCKRSNVKQIKLSRFDHTWECLVIDTGSDYVNFLSACNDASLIYIDGSLLEYNSYDDYLKFFVQNINFKDCYEPQIVITLQKKDNSAQFIDIKQMSKNLSVSKGQITESKFIKLRDLDPKEFFQADRIEDHFIYADTINIKFTKTNKDVKDAQIGWLNTKKFDVLRETIEYSITDNIEESDSSDSDTKIETSDSCMKIDDKEYPGLIYSIKIKQDCLYVFKGVPSGFTILFTSYLVVNPNYDQEILLGKETYKYEIFVMVKKDVPHQKHLYAIKYPVNDELGDVPVVNFDPSSAYYTKMEYYHKQLIKMLDTLYQAYVKNNQTDYSLAVDLQNVLKMQRDWFYGVKFMIERFKFENSQNSYHQLNNKLIENLQNKFNTKITFKLFDASYNYKSGKFKHSNGDSSENLLYGFVINKQIDLEDYKATPEKNRSDIIIALTITEAKQNKVSYIFLQKKNNDFTTGLYDKFAQKHYKEKAEKFLINAIEALQNKDIPSLTSGLDTTNQSPDVGPLEEYIKTIVLAMLNYIKKDYVDFFLFDNDFCQKALFYAKKELQKMEALAYKGTLTPVNKTSTNQKEVETKEGKDTGKEYPKKISNVEFIESEIKRICNFESFEEVLTNFSDLCYNKALDKTFLEILEHLHGRFVVEFLAYTENSIPVAHFAYLQHNNIAEDEETTNKIHDAIKELF